MLHGDIPCSNIFLDENLDVKLGDFAGSAIDDIPPLIYYETSHELPWVDISTKTEIFFLGSTVYEFMMGFKPYKDLPDHEVSDAFLKGRFPNLDSLPALTNSIMKCWRQDYITTEEAPEDIRLESVLTSIPWCVNAKHSYSRFYRKETHVLLSYAFTQLSITSTSFRGYRYHSHPAYKLVQTLEMISCDCISKLHRCNPHRFFAREAPGLQSILSLMQSLLSHFRTVSTCCIRIKRRHREAKT